MVYIIGEHTEEVKNIYELIKQEKNIFRKNGDKLGVDACGFLAGEIERDPNKDTSDEKVIDTLSKIRKNITKNPNPDIFLVQLIDTYIPPPVSDAEVQDWFMDEYGFNEVRDMGKRAFSIIGQAKRYFSDRPFNVEVLRKNIEAIIDDK